MSRWPDKYVIGLTGNIAVGKSVVRQMLQHLGAYTIDADSLAHQAMAPGAPAYRRVVDLFGRFILDAQGRIDRRRLGGIVFNLPEALAALEQVVHPVVIAAINTLAGRAQQRVIVIEAIKLLESDLAGLCDAVWVVDATPETQLRRLTERRGMTADEARRRIAAQPPQADKRRRATRVIDNNGSVDDTWRQVQAAWNEATRAPDGASGPIERGPAVGAPLPAAAPAGGVTIQRGMPDNAELIAGSLSRLSGRSVDRMDIMLAFGQKSYLLALDRNERVVGIVGWQVENLITRVDELYVDPLASRDAVIGGLLAAVDEASKALQAEVGFIVLPAATPPDALQAFGRSGYQPTTLDEIRIPAWREAIHEMNVGSARLLSKQLRPDRVMRPI